MTFLLCVKPATAGEFNSQQISNLREMFEGIIAGNNYRHEHNYCRVIKNLGKDAVSCEIYQSVRDHSEITTRIDLDYIDNEGAPIASPVQTKQINNYTVRIWQDKIFVGPRRPQILMTTYVVKIAEHAKLTMTCWEGHKCYAEQLVEQLNRQSLSKIIGGK